GVRGTGVGLGLAGCSSGYFLVLGQMRRQGWCLRVSAPFSRFSEVFSRWSPIEPRSFCRLLMVVLALSVAVRRFLRAAAMSLLELRSLATFSRCAMVFARSPSGARSLRKSINAFA